MSEGTARPGFTLQAIGGPTALLTYGGLRLLTDPTFDPPGDYGSGEAVLTKLAGPALAADRVEPIDAVLLSHDHHPDNLDRAGRAVLTRAGRVLTTSEGARRLGGSVTGLAPGDVVELERGSRPSVRVTAVDAQHGPPGVAERTGPVIGFVLQARGEPTVYVSGDNASIDVVRDIARRFGPIDVAVLFVGGAQVKAKYGDVHLTLTAGDAAAAARVLSPATIIPVHQDGWRHFTSDAAAVERAFAAAGMGDRLRSAHPGTTVTA